MTFKALLKRLGKMSEDQLNRPAVVLEGSSGRWSEVDWAVVARKDEYDEECAPGERRHQEFVKDGFEPPASRVKKGECYLMI